MGNNVVLAIETSARIGGVAVVGAGGEVLAEEVLEDGMKHGRLLLPAIDGVLTRAGIALADLGAIAVSIGPGSYTGTRVGVIAGKTLGFAAGVQVVPVSSLEALALASGCRGVVVPLQFARSDELYTGVYRVGADLRTEALVADIALEPDLVKEMVANFEVNCFIGSGLERFEEEFAGYREQGIDFLTQLQAAPASCVGKVAQGQFDRAQDPLTVEPVYMRRDSSPCTFERFHK